MLDCFLLVPKTCFPQVLSVVKFQDSWHMKEQQFALQTQNCLAPAIFVLGKGTHDKQSSAYGRQCYLCNTRYLVRTVIVHTTMDLACETTVFLL